MIYILLHACNNVLHYKNARDIFFWKGGGVYICLLMFSYVQVLSHFCRKCCVQ